MSALPSSTASITWFELGRGSSRTQYIAPVIPLRIKFVGPITQLCEVDDHTRY
ncbi:MAG: hypothetical protein NZ928_01385 [Endomicrobia bacterium]|nr:hypothetical protein [Endomicrobiia bacterium]